MMTAGEKLSANVKAVVDDCGYTSVWEEFASVMKMESKLYLLMFKDIIF